MQLLKLLIFKLVTLIRIAIKMWLILSYGSIFNCATEYGCAS